MLKFLTYELVFLIYSKMIITIDGIKTTESDLDVCSKSICRDTFDIKWEKQRLLETAPCPPPWQMSLIFSSSICLNCKQRIDVLYRCLKEWNIEMDCENILDCDDCVSCNICDFYGLDFDENAKQANKTNTNDVDEDLYIVLLVTFPLGGMITSTILIVCILQYKKKRHLNNRNTENGVLNVEIQVTLLKEESVDPDQVMTSGKLIDDNYHDNYRKPTIT